MEMHGEVPQEALGLEAEVNEIAGHLGLSLEEKDREHLVNRFRLLVEEVGREDAEHQIGLEIETMKADAMN